MSLSGAEGRFYFLSIIMSPSEKKLVRFVSSSLQDRGFPKLQDSSAVTQTHGVHNFCLGCSASFLWGIEGKGN